ncbi:acyltransferase [Bacillus sp. ISL-47]|uniref:acyltransferase n=1 Tax=Bacillus sp. ISL-47 TaxID=2819130 RepID=UPI001BEAC350|nr:acyltransferase [Bacillus sp. ISL-47]MBT2687093.1 acyltransferase [Bacillus sp. ISL-47]MBT2711080.1 acyltransferase [Pseudomonas sp. ISL-84]
MKKKSLDELQLARAFAIIAVLVVHSSSSGVTQLPPDSTLFPVYNFLNIAGKLGTPTFIMLSSFVLFYNYYHRKLTFDLMKNFYKKRLKFILLPYVVFSMLYFGLTWYLYYDFTLQEAADNFLWKLSLGKAYPHLYFVFISVQLYVLFPLLILLFKKSAFLRKNAIWLGLVIQWLWVWANREYFQVPFKGSISLSYMSFYFVGAYLGIHYDAIIEKMKAKAYKIRTISILTFGYLVMLGLYTSYMLFQRTGVYVDISEHWPDWINANMAEFTWATHALFAGVMLFVLAHFLNDRISLKTKALFMEIGATSFGIYLVHPMLLIFFRSFISGGSPALFHTWQITTFFAVFILSWLIVRFFYTAVPAYWVFFGKMAPLFEVPKKEKAPKEEREKSGMFRYKDDDGNWAYSDYPGNRKNKR